MLKLTVAVLILALAGTANAEWGDLRIDASSHKAFKRSLEAAKEELSPANVQMLGGALKHIWNEGTNAALAERRNYTAKDYYRQIDGLRYEDIVHFTDETYEAAQAQVALAQYRADLNGVPATPRSKPSSPANRYRHPTNQFGRSDFFNMRGAQPRGGSNLTGAQRL